MKKNTFVYYLLFLSLIQSVFSQAPANDLPCGAIPLTVNLSGTCVDQTISFLGTETDSNIGNPACAPYSGFDLWYQFTMPADGAVRIKTSSNTLIDDLAIELFSGSNCSSLTSFDCDDNGNPDAFPNEYFAQIDVVKPPGSTVFVRIWDVQGLEDGSFKICLFKIPTPLIANNDECSNAQVLALTLNCSTPLLTTNFQASMSSSPNPSCAANVGKDVWYQINVPNDKFYDVTIETSKDLGSSVYDTGMAIYSGTCGALNQIACNNDGLSDFFSIINLTGRKNETLYIRVFPEDFPQTGTFYICAMATETLGLEDADVTNFLMYPNPAKHIVNLKFDRVISNNIYVSAYNIQGKLVLETKKELQNKSTALDISTLTSGIYFLKVFNGEYVLNKKLVIK